MGDKNKSLKIYNKKTCYIKRNKGMNNSRFIIKNPASKSYWITIFYVLQKKESINSEFYSQR